MPFIEETSERGKEWLSFSEKVTNHVEKYTVPQYGDKPNDPINDWEVKDCIRDIKKRLERHGKNQREGQDSLDFIKIAHVSGVAYMKLTENNKNNKNNKWEKIKNAFKRILLPSRNT